MKAKERKLLAIVAVSVLGAAALFGAVKATVLSPAAALDQEANQLSVQIRDANKALDQREMQVARRLNELYRHAFGPDEGEVGEAMRELLTGLLSPSGLTEQFRSDPVDAKQIAKSKDRVVSRTINIRGGKLAHAINLLYLLAEEPHLHRFDTLNLKPSAERGKVDLTFQYSTLAMAVPKGHTAASGPGAATQLAMPSLDGEQRGLYRIIEERDIFRKYEKRPEPPPPTPVAAAPQPAPPPPPPNRQAPEEERWRVSGLPMMSGTDVVHIRHVQSGETRTYKIGQPLMTMEGKIVMVDTRTLRRHDNPKVFSDSRVILQMKDTFWAVELGDVLAQKHRLGPAELPPQLLAPTSAPAGALSRKDDGKP